MKILFIGDIYGRLGRETFARNLKRLRQSESYQLVIANGENTTHGKGLSDKNYAFLMSQNVNVITLGNHSFQNPTIMNVLPASRSLVRPENLPDGTPGVGHTLMRVNDKTVLVFQVIGQVFMNPGYTSPFAAAEKVLAENHADVTICDFHGEATSEKIAFGYAFDGRLSAILGTHTHVQTADERILPGGTATITDVGMTGALDGVIGTDRDVIIRRFTTHDPSPFRPQDSGATQFSAVELDIDEATGKARAIKRLREIEGVRP